MAGEVNKHVFDIGRQYSICCQVTPIGIQPSRTRVVVSCGQMGIAFQLSPLPPGNQHHLGVRLQAYHPVQHLCSDRLERLSPVDVGLFIKSRLEFNHHGDFLATANCLAKQVHQRRVAARAIDSLLDRQNLRVMNSFTQKIQHTPETFKWLVNEHITLLESIKK